MKKFVFILAAISWGVALGQTWQTAYITSHGDTVKAKARVELSADVPFSHVYPYANMGGIRMEAARRYLSTTMRGKSYQINRLSRIKNGKNKYTNIAILSIVDPLIHRQIAQEYYIEIEGALKRGEVRLVK